MPRIWGTWVEPAGNCFEQRHCKLLNLVLRRFFCKAVKFVCERKKRGGGLSNELTTYKTGVKEETDETVMAEKHPQKKTAVLCWWRTTKCLY